ncbi:NAD(P)H-dependent oxidoreductase [Cardiobacterium valvarum]|uniref:Flavodoxin-like protein n=1 Tax=Cardiobacterium valvarum F0432 TaxID=797473 RepID=G9ZG09_9GAMM|nr:NAD(P)H-dependent oxidoreductase [Cardiobacterium valvarum]EHM53579.1 flavodoxin-like protein [Cardiobacterium valvarum F0432]
MQHISVILAHPYTHSLNAAIAATVVSTLEKNGYGVHFHALYQEGFNPLISGEELAAGKSDDLLLRQHQEEIIRAHGIIIVHPNWWGQPPAILKGWMERVLRENIAYTPPTDGNGDSLYSGQLPAKAALVFNTSNTPTQREYEVFGDPLERIWKDCVFAFCGVHTFERLTFGVVADSDEATRQHWLQQAAEMVNKHFPATT